MKYRLKHKFWSGKLELWKDDNIIGDIENYSVWKGHSIGYLYEKKYFFMNKGVFANSFEIVDEMDHVIGKISYSGWTSKANISLNGKLYTWESIGFWGTKWKLVDELGREILLEKRQLYVNYNLESENEFLLLLSTFLLYNYQRKMAAAGVA